MVFSDTFNNISVCFRGLGLWCLMKLSTIFQFVSDVIVMAFNDTFNNISVCFRGLGLWCLMTLSTIFQFVLEGQGYDVERHFQQYFSLLQRVRVMVFNDTFNKISVCFRELGLWCITTLSKIFQFVSEGQGYGAQRHFQQYFSLFQRVRDYDV